jgi:hypothetical protein
VLPLHHNWNPRQLGNLKRGKTSKQSYFRPFSLTYCTFSAIKYLGKILNSFYNMKGERDSGLGQGRAILNHSDEFIALGESEAYSLCSSWPKKKCKVSF